MFTVNQQALIYIFTQIPAIKSHQLKVFKGVALILRRISSSDNDYIVKSKEHTKNLVNRGHDLKSVQQCFSNVLKHHDREDGNK